MDEHDPRPFQAVNIDMASTETGAERFVKDGLYRPPPTASWRCNLTALSQRYNLYFIASKSGIAVYQPDFPFQKLKRTPKLYIVPTLANVDAEGYLDVSHPHSINHLIVGDLGSEEILLASTDSGNVTAYHTKAIEDAIKKDPYKFSTDARSDYVGLRAFFSQWVEESAWGLAIHREARMIAVSANTSRYPTYAEDTTAKITVYAFALTKQEPEENETDHVVDVEAGLVDNDWTDWSSETQATNTPSRDRNYKIVLGGSNGHSSNIPSISFVNTSNDEHGAWLLSTDISGSVKLWQIWRGTCRQTWMFGYADDVDRDMGWIVAALDPAAFREARTMQQFCGHHMAPKYSENAGESYDLTNIVRLTIPGRSQRHPILARLSDDEDDLEEDTEVADHYSEEEFGDSHEDAARGPLGLPTGTETTSMAIRAGEVVDERNEPAQEQDGAGPPADLEDILLDHYDSELEDSDDEFDHDSRVGGSQLDEGSDDDVTASSDSFASGTSFSDVSQRSSVDVEFGPMSITSPRARTRDSPADPIEVAKAKKRRRIRGHEKPEDTSIPNIPTLHCSTVNVRLLDAHRARVPHVFCHDPLQQQLPMPFRGQVSQMRRLNMVQQIPELGVVIIASQLGRCALYALTRNRQTGTLGLRADWILPTKRQERAGQRPNSWLLGIAAAPIQGRWLETPSLATGDGAWGKDSNNDGVQVSFDPGVFVLPESLTELESSDSEAERRVTHAAKRHRRTSAASATSSSGASTQKRPWAKSKTAPGFKAVENSRRYRLMMTYADMTVLTYEISRDVERDEVQGGLKFA
ncbi:uncharacterized protein HMPREF1541_04792 [Cyphellophora europaea CBS 101466]|uniref:Uncharacterized protein n=1 Tax=Cyphellophora europaea (strain CBS 101466) TaxID=1220924 RepID=W2RW19_CYPE1|nr:uncharacterized protein HMPREF1541_04792 [Cyphellophora europaea CBS 101466]ETN40515.1 hypothetical protein HMPREF1541_04792 [Cyphellophora europaea CBS 101466]